MKEIDRDQMDLQRQIAKEAAEEEPVPAYQDPGIIPPLDVEQYLKETDRVTAAVRATLMSNLWKGACSMGDAIDGADLILREVGYFRLRAQELDL